jgi:hypothetical protein
MLTKKKTRVFDILYNQTHFLGLNQILKGQTYRFHLDHIHPSKVVQYISYQQIKKLPGSNALKLIMFENLVYRILVDKYVNHIKTQQMVILYNQTHFLGLNQILKGQTYRFHYGSEFPAVTITVFITILEQNR